MKLGLIGAGNMASALARGIGEPVVVHDIDEAKARALAEELGGEAVGSNAEVAERTDALVLCHKPKQLEEVASQVDGRAKVVISILAATSTERIADKVFLLTPRNVEVSAEERARLIEKGFFNQS